MLKYLIFDSRREINFCQFGQQTEEQVAVGWVPWLEHDSAQYVISESAINYQHRTQLKLKLNKSCGSRKLMFSIQFSFHFPWLSIVFGFRSWLITDLWLDHRFAWHLELNYLMLMRLFLFSGYFPINDIPTKLNDFIRTKMLVVCHN